jgi:hypothetical protein
MRTSALRYWLPLWVGVAVAVLGGCRRPGRIDGTLVLPPSDTGDVRRIPVLVYEYPSPESAVVEQVLSDTSSDRRRASFGVDSLTAGEYFLLAWSDVNSSDSIDDGDLVGVRGADFSRTSLGQSVKVDFGALAQAGDVVVRVLREPVKDVEGTRDSSRTATDFRYSLNHRLLLSTLTITFPGYGAYIDPTAPGWKDSDTLYRSDGWEFGGAEMPSGEHRVRLTGRMDDKPFDVEFRIEVQ